MALFVFKIIFLVVFGLGVLAMVAAPLFYGKQDRSKPEVYRKIVKTRMIALVVAATGLLVVLILGAF